MVGGLITRAYPYSTTQSEFCHNPVSAYTNSHFVDDFQIPPIASYPKSIIPYKDVSMTSEKSFANQTALCDSVLKFIDHVLMEDDDFEFEAATLRGPKLDATKRSFHEIILGNNPHDEDSDEDSEDMARAKSRMYSMEDNESFVDEMFSKMAVGYDKDDECTLMTHHETLPKHIVCKREGIVLRNLLLQCMQSVAISDHNKVNNLLEEIRSRASANGDGTQRLAHYFADGLEARVKGGGVSKYKTLAVKIFADNEILKAFKLYLTTFPFSETSYFFANQTIMELAEKAKTLHIVNFAIMHGLQWPSFIQQLSKRPGGPPKLRITAIDFPQTGFRPDARVKDTGRRLAGYCAKYNVPFEYDCLAKSWEEVELEDIRIEKDETLVVTCMYHFMYMRDDTLVERSPRDKVLNLIKRINPDMFLHVIVNGAYNSPFFVSRSREAMFQYSAWFDMFHVNLPRESPERMVFEKEVWSREILNIMASEGSERAERPETYRQWQQRTIRAGFKPIPLNSNIVKQIRTRVKTCYHKDFFVDESGPWLIDGWKGRALFGASCWKPVK